MTISWTQKLLSGGMYDTSESYLDKITKVTSIEKQQLEAFKKKVGQSNFTQSLPMALTSIYSHRLGRTPSDLSLSLIAGIPHGALGNAFAESVLRNGLNSSYIKTVASNPEYSWSPVPKYNFIDELKSNIVNTGIKFLAKNPELAAFLETYTTAGIVGTAPFSNIPSQTIFGQPAMQMQQQVFNSAERNRGFVSSTGEPIFTSDSKRVRSALGMMAGLGIQLWAMQKSGIMPTITSGSWGQQILKAATFNITLGATIRAGEKPKDAGYIFRVTPEKTSGNIFTDIKERGWDGSLDWVNTLSFDLAMGVLDTGIIAVGEAGRVRALQTTTRNARLATTREMAKELPLLNKRIESRESMFDSTGTIVVGEPSKIRVKENLERQKKFNSEYEAAKESPYTQSELEKDWNLGRYDAFGTARLPKYMRIWNETIGWMLDKYQWGFGLRSKSTAFGIKWNDVLENTWLLQEGIYGSEQSQTLLKPVQAAFDTFKQMEADSKNYVNTTAKETYNLREMLPNKKVVLKDGTELATAALQREYVNSQMEQYLTTSMSSSDFENNIRQIYGNKTYNKIINGKSQTYDVAEQIALQNWKMKGQAIDNNIASTEAKLWESYMEDIEDITLLDKATAARNPYYLARKYNIDTDSIEGSKEFLKRVKDGNFKINMSAHKWRKDKYGIFIKEHPMAKDHTLLYTLPDDDIGKLDYERILKELRGEGEDWYNSKPQQVYDFEVLYELPVSKIKIDKPTGEITGGVPFHDKVQFYRNGWNKVKGYVDSSLNRAKFDAIDEAFNVIDESVNAQLGKARVVRDSSILKHTGLGQIEYRKRKGVMYGDYVIHTDPLNEFGGTVIQRASTGEMIAQGLANTKDAKRVLYRMQTENETAEQAISWLQDAYAEVPHSQDKMFDYFIESVDNGIKNDESVKYLVEHRPQYLDNALNYGKFNKEDFNDAIYPEFALDNASGKPVMLTMDLNKQWWNHLPSDAKIYVKHRAGTTIEAGSKSSSITNNVFELNEAGNDIRVVVKDFFSPNEAKRYIKELSDNLIESLDIRVSEPLTEAQRAKLGEVTDPLERYQHGMLNATRDLHVAEFSSTVKTQPEVWAGTTEPSVADKARMWGLSDDIETDLVRAAARLEHIDPLDRKAYIAAKSTYDTIKRDYDLMVNTEYVKLPSIEFDPITRKPIMSSKQTQKALAYGELQGHWIPKAWSNHMEEFTGVPIGDLKAFGRASAWIMRRFKKNKTILNPITHINQFIGNSKYSYVAGNWIVDPVNKKWYDQSWQQWRDTGDIYIQAKALGVLEDMASNEMRYKPISNTDALAQLKRRFSRAELSKLNWAKQLEEHLPSNPVGKKSMEVLINTVESIYKGAGDAESAAAAVYQFSDNYYKLATFIKATAPITEGGWGWTIDQAREHIFKFYPNYSRFSKWVRVARNNPLINPFISFTLEDTRIRLQTIKDYPIRAFMSDVALPSLTTLAGGFASGLSMKRIYQINKDRPSYRKSNIVNSMLMKLGDAYYNWSYSGFYPGADAFDAYVDSTDPVLQQIVQHPAFKTVFNSALFSPAIALSMNVDPQTDREIYTKSGGGFKEFIHNFGEVTKYANDKIGPGIFASYRYLQTKEALTQKPISAKSIEYTNVFGTKHTYQWTVKREIVPTFLKNFFGARIDRVEPIKEALSKMSAYEYIKRNAKGELNRLEKLEENGGWTWNDTYQLWIRDKKATKQPSEKFKNYMAVYLQADKEVEKMNSVINELQMEGFEMPPEKFEYKGMGG